VAAHVHDFSWSGVRRYLEPWFAAEAFSVSSEEKRTEAQKSFSETRERAPETRDRRLSGSGAAEARVLRL